MPLSIIFIKNALEIDKQVEKLMIEMSHLNVPTTSWCMQQVFQCH